jgi:predicted phage baseplate assembly protein
VPLSIENPPGQPSIRYRIGTFTSFRRAMLDALTQGTQVKQGAAAIRTDKPEGDYQTMFVELWAYLADVLTFYQERIANEAFLQTATQRDSLLRLCRLIDYRPNPGAGASALLAFTVEKNKSILIPAGFRAGNKPTPGQDPAVFETDASLAALGLHSAIPISTTAPTNQFAKLEDYQAVAVGPTASAETSSAATEVFGSSGAIHLQSFMNGPLAQLKNALSESFFGGAAVVTLAMLKATASRAELENQSPAASFESRLVLPPKVRPVVLKGTKTRLAAGDYVLIVDKGQQRRTPRQLDSVRVDKATDTTTIYWTETDPLFSYDREAELFAFRVKANAFGNDAPNWHMLSPTLTNRGGGFKDVPFPDYWDLPIPLPTPPPKPKRSMFPDSATKTLNLDTTYAEVKATEDKPVWAVLLPNKEVVRVVGANSATLSDYAMTAKVTQLKLDEDLTAGAYPLRTTVILAASERLTLQDDLPLPRTMAGDTLILAGQFPALAQGQKVVLRGKRILDPISLEVAATPSAEEAEIKTKPVVSVDHNLTTVVLKAALQQTYERASTVLLANVVAASQGETVKDEVLGSGNGGAFQSFTLKKKPLTYLPSIEAEGPTAVKSTLGVSVNGVQWKETPTLFERAASAQEFTTREDEAGQTTVTFGDGLSGARPPSGRDNVRARYRKGMGINGNVAPNAIAQMLDNIPGLQKVANPQQARGGLDRERPDQIRGNAPGSLRTFGQAVSVHDYADIALSFPGVAKASAAWVVVDPKTRKAVAQPHVLLTIVLSDQAKLAEQSTFAGRLRAFIDRRRDPNVPLRVTDGTPIYIDSAVSIVVDERFPRQATLARVQAALSPNPNPGGPLGYFAFERLQFGQSIALSDLYHAIHAVDGVRNAVVTVLQRTKPDSPPTEPADILVGPTELIVLKNDPADVSKGKLTVTGEGGFVDT